MVDIKLGQKTFGRYLTGCCLFPPSVLEDTDAYNFDKFFHVTGAVHDELWFWCMTTMKGVKSIGLNYTYSFDADEVVLPRDENSLSRINSDPYLRSYNDKINAEFGAVLTPVLAGQVCEFPLNRDNLLAVAGNLIKIYQIYGQCYRVRFTCDRTILKSHRKFFESCIRNFGASWPNGMEVADVV